MLLKIDRVDTKGLTKLNLPMCSNAMWHVGQTDAKLNYCWHHHLGYHTLKFKVNRVEIEKEVRENAVGLRLSPSKSHSPKLNPHFTDAKKIQNERMKSWFTDSVCGAKLLRISQTAPVTERLGSHRALTPFRTRINTTL